MSKQNKPENGRSDMTQTKPWEQWDAAVARHEFVPGKGLYIYVPAYVPAQNQDKTVVVFAQSPVCAVLIGERAIDDWLLREDCDVA